MIIADFPKDGFWVVKWIDGYKQSVAGERSTLVQVLLQRLDARDVGDALAKTPAMVFSGPSVHQRKNAGVRDPECLPVWVSAGTIPLLSKGFVFYQQEFVGKLKTEELSLTLPSFLEDGSDIRIWNTKPFDPQKTEEVLTAVLNQFQYWLPESARNSRALVHEENGIEFVIPRQVIFQTFYGPHREMANAFCNGPWSKTASEVIAFEVKENGLQTRAVPEMREWHIVLRTLVEDDYAQLLALLWFEPYARSCANSIHTQRLQDARSFEARRGGDFQSRSDVDAQYEQRWLCSACLPFRPEHPLRLKVEGYELKSWKREHINNRKFLVTRILGANPPKYVWRIGYERENSNAESLNHNPPDRQPHGARGASRNADPPKKPRITAKQDPHAQGNIHHVEQAHFSWSEKWDDFVLKKTSSVSSQACKGPRPPEPKNTSSTGNRGGADGGRAPDQQSARVPVLDVSERFDDVIRALKNFDGRITGKIFNPPDRLALEVRGNLSCWNFLTADERTTSRLPRHGWRVLVRGSREWDGRLRAAMVASIEFQGQQGLLIEIECSPSGSSFCGVILVGAPKSGALVFAALGKIARCDGRNLEINLAQFAKENNLLVHQYQHQTKVTKVAGMEVRRFDEEAFLRSIAKAFQTRRDVQSGPRSSSSKKP